MFAVLKKRFESRLIYYENAVSATRICIGLDRSFLCRFTFTTYVDV